MSDQKQTTKVDQIKARLMNRPILALLVIFSSIVISISAFTDALQKLWSVGTLTAAFIIGTATPTLTPTATPTLIPTATPTQIPTATPTLIPTVPPTLTATSTPPPTLTSTSTPSLTSTSTPTATETPTHTPTFTPMPAATPTSASVQCQISVPVPFDQRYQSAQELGCPTNLRNTTLVAVQQFERGRMFWRDEPRYIYVLHNDGNAQRFPDLWREGDTIRVGYPPPDNHLYEPERGFGKIWREKLGGAEASTIGWGTDIERRFNAVVQDFDNGFMIFIEDDRYGLYVLYFFNEGVGGTWKR